MKVFVLYGVHEEEKTEHICKELKKNDYEELNRFISENRPLLKRITEEEVKFKDMSGYGTHAAARKFLDTSLEDILDIYGDYIGNTKLPSPVREYIKKYVLWWKDKIEKWKKEGKDFERSRLEEQDIRELRGFISTLYSTHGKSIHTRFDADTKYSRLFIPDKLSFLVRNLGYFDIYLDSPKTYKGHPELKEELNSCKNAFIIDLHSSPQPDYKKLKKFLKNADGSSFKREYKWEPVISSPVFLKKYHGINFEKIKASFQQSTDGIPYVTEDVFGLADEPPHFKCSDENFGLVALEIFAPYIKTDLTREFEVLKVLPKTCFFYYLLDFGRKIREELGLGMIKDAGIRALEVDSRFYKTERYRNAKRAVARFIREVLEWGEKWEAMAVK